MKRWIALLPALALYGTLLAANMYWYGVMHLARTQDLTAAVMFWASCGSATLALILKAIDRTTPAKITNTVSILLLAALFVHTIRGEDRRNENTVEQNAKISERYLAEATHTAPCDNGDTALIRIQKIGSVRETSLEIVHQNRSHSVTVLAFTSERGRVLDPGAMNHYLERTQTKCRSAEFKNLESMLDYVKSH